MIIGTDLQSINLTGGVASTITSARSDPQHQPSVIVGVDCYNQTLTGGVSRTMTNISTDTDHIPCVLSVDGYNGSVDDKASTLGINCGISTGRNGVMVLNDQGGQ